MKLNLPNQIKLNKKFINYLAFVRSMFIIIVKRNGKNLWFFLSMGDLVRSFFFSIYGLINEVRF